MPNLVAVGAYFRQLRQHKGMNTTTLGALIGSNETQVRNIERGRIDTRFSNAMQLCELLDGSPLDVQRLVLGDQATAEDGIRLAEQRIAERRTLALAEGRGEYRTGGEG